VNVAVIAWAGVKVTEGDCLGVVEGLGVVVLVRANSVMIFMVSAFVGIWLDSILATVAVSRTISVLTGICSEQPVIKENTIPMNNARKVRESIFIWVDSFDTCKNGVHINYSHPRKSGYAFYWP
jgi:hypothetical protein